MDRLSTLEEREYHTQDAHQDSFCTACLHIRYVCLHSSNVAVILLLTSPGPSLKKSLKFRVHLQSESKLNTEFLSV